MIFDFVYLLIDLLSDWHFTVLASLLVAILAALLGLARGRRASLWAGGIAGLVSLVVLGSLNWLLNAPLGEPFLSALSPALPPDYLALWLLLAAAFGVACLAGLALLALILSEVRAIRKG